MASFADAPLIGPGSELQLTIDGGAVAHEHVVAEAVLEPPAAAGKLIDGLEVGEEAEALELDLALARVGAREKNLYVAGERLAARAASPATRRQYASIYRTFGDWLRGELERPPTTSDLTADAIAAFARHLETSGGRGGGPASPATRRIYVNMVRALARDAGLAEEADRVRVPRHRAGPPETLTDADYANLLRVPDRRAVIGKRDVALLRMLGDCGLRSAELRGLVAGDLRRPRSNARHFRLFVRGKGGTEREATCPRRPRPSSTHGWRSTRSHGAAGCATTSRSSCASGVTAAMRSPRRSPPRPSTSSSTTPPSPRASLSGCAIRTRCAPTGPPRC